MASTPPDPQAVKKRERMRRGEAENVPHRELSTEFPLDVTDSGAALKDESYGTDEFVRSLSVEVTTCFTALTTKVYLVSKIIESEPRPDFRKSTSTTSAAKKKGRATKKKSDTTLSDLGPIPHQIDVMMDFFLYELDNGVTGVLGLLSRKQISERFKDYDMTNKWNNFESLLRNVNGKSGVDSLYGRNVVNYDTIKKYKIMYREILVWYMKNVNYPPGADYTSEALCFHTKGNNCSPSALKEYVKSMKNFLDCLMTESSLGVSMSHSYNQVDLDNHFKKQQDMNIPEMGKVLLPLHSPLVFHYVLNYKDTLSNYYNIHFELDDDRVTLSPCKLGTGKIDLAHFNVIKGILYLVKQWLITKFVNHGTNLGVNVVLSLETACNLFICQVLCASMIRVNGVDSSFDCLIDNVCKKIIQKVFKSPHKGCFGYDHVMETIEGLVLTKRSFLKGAMVPKSTEGNTQFAHVKFEDRPEELVTGILELSGLEDQHKNQTCVTRFLQYDVNSQQEVHQRGFMEHIPYVFREIFVIDPEVVERHTWVEELIHYSYLPEMGTIFTLLTEKLARYLLEKSDDLSLANLVVQFLDDNIVNNYGKGTGELNPVFKHHQGHDFVFYKPSDLQTWDCFKTSKVEINEFNQSNNTYQVGWVTFTFNTTNHSKHGFIPPWVVQVDGGNVAKRSNLNEGKNNNSGSTVTGKCSKNKANKSKESGIDTTKGNSKDAGLTNKTSKTGEKEGSNVREEEVRDLAESPIHAVVALPKFPLKINGGPPAQPFDLCVVLKDPDPELMFPLYKVNKQVRYTATKNGPVLIGEVSRYLFDAYKQYERLPGYYLIFKKGKAGEHAMWCPYFQVSHLKETNSQPVKRVSDLVKCNSKERGNCESTDGNVEGFESSSDTTKPVSDCANPGTVLSKDCTKRMHELNHDDLNNNGNPFLYHFETGFDALCAKNGHLVTTILFVCQKIEEVRKRLNSKKGHCEEDEALNIWEQCYITEEVFPNYKEGNTDHKKTNEAIIENDRLQWHCRSTDNNEWYSTQERFPTIKEEKINNKNTKKKDQTEVGFVHEQSKKTREQDKNKWKIKKWLNLYKKRWNSPEDLEEYNNCPIPCGAWGRVKH
eukprot:jgi/Psemu1/30316/gm1.30316_g